jgi:hypothetical protein
MSDAVYVASMRAGAGEDDHEEGRGSLRFHPEARTDPRIDQWCRSGPLWRWRRHGVKGLLFRIALIRATFTGPQWHSG